jgi:glycosyltransferase involved in cell wall biosynthesis
MFAPELMSGPAIAFDVTPLQNAHRHRGIGTYVRGLAHRLSAQSDIPLEFWGWAGEDVFEAPPPHRNLFLARFPMPEYRGAWLFAQLAMRRRAGKSEVRAVHVTDPDALTPLAGRKLLATVYDLIPLKQGVPRSGVITRAGYRTYLRALRHVDTLFAISDQTAADLVETLHVPAKRVLVARPGIDLSASAGARQRAAQPYFLFLGGPNPNKNLSVVLEAMAICTELSEELRVAGHWLSKQVAALEGRVNALGLRGRVRYVGFVPSSDLADLMQEATALIIASRYEGFGLPVGEGLAAGALVIHSRIPVLEETSAGAALTFDPESAEELAACMRRAATDVEPQSSLRLRGIQRAKELTWDAAVETTLTAYRDAIGG